MSGQLMQGRTSRVVAVLVAVVAVIAVTAVVLGTRHPAVRDVTTPQGVVQAYLTAVTAGDNDRASGYLLPDTGCDVADLDRVGSPGPVRVDLLDSTVTADTALVRVSVVHTDGGPFADPTGEEQVFRLRRTDSGWRLAGTPWPLFDCVGDSR